MPKKALALISLLTIGFPGCTAETNAGSAGKALTGTVSIDGSSTVFPITEAIAEEFRKVHPDIRVNIGVSGTGGGFKKFCVGETVINNASRPIKGKEQELAKKNEVGFIELPVAYDGITVVMNKENSFVNHLTVAELKKIWQPGSAVDNWKDVRTGFPDLPLKLFGPGADSGTFDYFTKAVNGKEKACRADYTASEDDNVIVTGVVGEKGGLGFFGYAYYAENKDQLKAAPIVGESGTPISPTLSTINDGTYAPLSRPIFIYVTSAGAVRPEVKTFVDFYLAEAASIVGDVGYVALPEAIYAAAKKRFADRVTGTLYPSSKTLLELHN